MVQAVTYIMCILSYFSCSTRWDLPDPEIECLLYWQGGSLPLVPLVKPKSLGFREFPGGLCV